MQNPFERYIAIGTLLAVLFGGAFLIMRGGGQSPEQVCQQRCAAVHKSGALVYRGPATPKPKIYQMDRDCECS
jgi:hypothetical protein